MSESVDKYNEWVKEKQERQDRNHEVLSDKIDSVKEVALPIFDHKTLFLPEVEEYAFKMTTPCGPDFRNIEDETNKNELYAPCMVGRIEAQMLKMIARFGKARRVLDIGTFTGYSALAFAESLPQDGQVITIEADHKTAEVARKCFEASKHGKKIHLLEGDGKVVLQQLINDKEEPFDIVFIDADKVNYLHYYEMGLKLLNDNGIIMADNALGSLVYDQSTDWSKKIHDFLEHVRKDSRVEQTLLTVREGVLIVHKKTDT